MQVLVTGSSGLIGSEAVRYLDAKGYDVVGVDNNMRRDFFGPTGDTVWNRDLLLKETKRFRHLALDIRDKDGIFDLFRRESFDWILHCAAQPSHDRAAAIPILDFEVNALGTLHLLEATRLNRPNAVFTHMSTNKVYGDAPNELTMLELESRYDYADEPYRTHGIAEDMRIDNSLHSVFGASKLAADVMVQEYGKYYGLKTGAFRGGCLTGPRHSGVELHGFLSYLVKCVVQGMPYTIYGYKGKQVRDNIHSEDVIRALECFAEKPHPGEVYNIGGGKNNSLSMLEAIAKIESLAGRKLDYTVVDAPRRGDHICYFSDLRKLQSHFPEWKIKHTTDAMLVEMVDMERARSAS